MERGTLVVSFFFMPSPLPLEEREGGREEGRERERKGRREREAERKERRETTASRRERQTQKTEEMQLGDRQPREQ